MKILYVLTSSESDFYCEQAIISMMSAKHQMPNCFISLLIDSETESNLKGTRNLINEYISEKNVINLDSALSSTQKSRWLKTSMRELVKGDFLYVDVDTVFAQPIDESIFTADVMGVPDANCPLDIHPQKWWILENLKKMGYTTKPKYHINGGVFFFKDSPHAHLFAKKWHKYWLDCCKKDIFIDQPALHQTISEFSDVFSILPDFMNAQFGKNINTLAKAVILHYYSSWRNNPSYTPAYKFLQKEWLLNFRNDPYSGEFQELIYNPKEAFDQTALIIGRNFNLFFNSKLANHLANLQASSDKADKRLFTFFEKQNMFLAKIYYRIIKILYPLKKFSQKKSKN